MPIVASLITAHGVTVKPSEEGASYVDVKLVDLSPTVTLTLKTPTQWTSAEICDVWCLRRVTESSDETYAFRTLRHRQLFQVLLQVEGVGASKALQALSNTQLEQDLQAGDAKALAKRTNGIGEKTATALIEAYRKWAGVAAAAPAAPATPPNPNAEDAVKTLTALGRKATDAKAAVAAAVKACGPTASTQELIKAALS